MLARIMFQFICVSIIGGGDSVTARRRRAVAPSTSCYFYTPTPLSSFSCGTAAPWMQLLRVKEARPCVGGPLPHRTLEHCPPVTESLVIRMSPRYDPCQQNIGGCATAAVSNLFGSGWTSGGGGGAGIRVIRASEVAAILCSAAGSPAHPSANPSHDTRG
jgi:hypothetical protein